MSKLSFIEAAYQILKKKATPLSSEEIISIALKENLISTKGKTPSRTMGARIYIDIKTKRERSKFRKIEKAKFALAEWAKKVPASTFQNKSFKDAAYKVLGFIKHPLNFEEITNVALNRQWLKTSGRTPARTMGAQLYTDIKERKEKSPFVQLGKRKFGLRGWGLEVMKEEIKKSEGEKELLIGGRKRTVTGEPLNFEGLIYAPLNENGVIFLFSKIHEKFNIKIEAIQPFFPDAKGRRRTTKGWEDIWIEFEYKSSNFKQHKHNPEDCDIIVCWEHDWKECPIEVIELKKILEKL